MADAPDTIEQRILIKLDEQINIGRQTLTVLQTLSNSTLRLSKASENASKSTKDLQKHMTKLTKSYRKAVGVVKKFTRAAAVLLSIRKMTRVFVQNVDTMRKFEIASWDSKIAVDNLAKSYNNISSEAGYMTTTIYEAADSLADFASKGLEFRAAASMRDFSDQFVKVQEQLSKKWGATFGRDLMRKVTSGMSKEQVGVFETAMKSLKSGGEGFLAAMLGGDMGQEAFDMINAMKGPVSEQAKTVAKLRKAWDAVRVVAIDFVMKIGQDIAQRLRPALTFIAAKIFPVIRAAMNDIMDIISDNKESIGNMFKYGAVMAVQFVKASVIVGKWLVKHIKLVVTLIALYGVLKLAAAAYHAKALLGNSKLVGSVTSLGTSLIAALPGWLKLIGVVVALGGAIYGLWKGKKKIDEIKKSVEDFDMSKLKLDMDLDKMLGPQVSKALKDIEDAGSDGADSMSDLEKSIKKALERFKPLSDQYNKFKDATNKANTFRLALDGVNKSLSGLTELFETLGPAMLEGMPEFAGALQQTLEQASKTAEEGFRRTSQMVAEARKAYELAPDSETQALLQRAVGDAMEEAAKYAKAQQNIIKATLAPTAALVGYRKAEQDLIQTNLGIYKSIYGTAGLAVSAQMRAVENLEQQKSLLATQVKQLEQLAATHQDEMIYQVELLKKRKELRDITRQQVEMVKELRDGYMDAITAQAFGAGRFEKILITQEQNVGKALDENMAKRNQMIGLAGKEARNVNIQSKRFVTGRPGQLGYTTGGGAVDVGQEMQETVKAVSGGRYGGMAAQAVTQAQKMMFGGANPVVQSQDNLADSTDRLNQTMQQMAGKGGAIDQFGSKMARTAATGAALKGTPGGGVVVGEAARQAMGGGGGRIPGFFQVRDVVKKQAAAAGAAQAGPTKRADLNAKKAVKLKSYKGKISAKSAGGPEEQTAQAADELVEVAKKFAAAADVAAHEKKVLWDLDREDRLRGIAGVF